MTAPLVVTPLLGWPEVTEGADLAALLAPTLAGMPTPIAIVLSSKIGRASCRERVWIPV